MLKSLRGEVARGTAQAAGRTGPRPYGGAQPPMSSPDSGAPERLVPRQAFIGAPERLGFAVMSSGSCQVVSRLDGTAADAAVCRQGPGGPSDLSQMTRAWKRGHLTALRTHVRRSSSTIAAISCFLLGGC